MKDKDVIKKDLLGTLIGEASKETKEPDDAKIIATIKKFINNAKETQGHALNVNQSMLHQLQAEIDILEAYLPKQLSEDGIRAAIKMAINLGNDNMGAIMKYMKENHEGRYDGSLASKLAKESLANV